MIQKLTDLFPLWAVLFSVLAYFFPELFSPIESAIVPLLGVVMFGMGMTLTASSFTSVLTDPRTIILGAVLQFGLMPVIGWGVAKAFQLPAAYAVGVILVGCAPGGTASNVITYLARGNVAFSITLTSVSTFLAVPLMPLLTKLYVGQSVHVPVVKMLVSILKIVIVPVTLGVLVNTYLERLTNRFKQAFPLVSVFAIVFIISIIVALNRENLRSMGVPVMSAVVFHNLIGLAAGYGIAKGFRIGERECRTLAVEVGMQNSGLGVALAIKYFSAAAALPGAIFSVWHNLSGSALAGYWSKRKSS